MTRLVWFRNDLRTIDNPALHYCCEGEVEEASRANSIRVAAIYVLCQEYIDTHPIGEKKLGFIKNALLNLSSDLAQLGIVLDVLYVERKRDIAESVADYCQKWKVTDVYLNKEYPLDERERDRDVEKRCLEEDIAFHSYHDRCLIPPGAVKTQAGSYYKVFTPFSKAWLQLARATDFTVYPRPSSVREPVDVAHRAIEAVFLNVTKEGNSSLWPADEKSALEALRTFTKNHIVDYHNYRDIPSELGTSKISPYLTVGLLSPKQCYIAARQADASGNSQGVSTWLNELIWREFYMHVVAIFSKVCKGFPLITYTENIPWRDSEADFEKWCAGITGIPIVDAAMRQLNSTGWMHNRLRMVVAMFLTKNLLIDWRKGEAYFMSQLIDGDFSANNGGWQWCASTGTDSAPYFRVMNPVAQSERYDPKGDFIRQWVPELAHLDNKKIHNPSGVNGYPEAMVDLKSTRKEAIAVFKSAKDAVTGEYNEL
ncbi:deoxyribodipyrimidine photo-lyase [Gilvimarinus sp. SDUM040013]|uniref:Deoxyribodipyrimidine photo-lyase n=1 Tax=Gilvimarinus gilvus TaxID=3058038 RepID=A0ABU4S279_9GAMM|nr:deoxyribodipyrimidine photo-lyase [Gilvimarinus sp. SDUM040013]MDO3385567.1 deoxyribodipyrimidine photo-lyase [Gilvimarinus sp. SDUM040013]MDX6851182.1 deoxyribodipyrimidine photo-lyase [Gilvimarinus sp. SDUM040013]